MSRSGDSLSAARTRQQRPFKLVMVAARGLLVGVTGLAVAALAAAGVARTVEQEEPSCTGEISCLPDPGPLIFAAVAFPVALVVVGPLVARLVRLPSPGLFALPVLWVVVIVSVELEPADARRAWPFTSALVAIYLLLNILVAVWAGARRRRGEKRPAQAEPTGR